MTDEGGTAVPIGFRKVKERRVDALRAWADAYLRALLDEIPIAAAQVEADNGRTFLRMRVEGRTAELETSFQAEEDPARRAASFRRWHRRDGIGEALGLADSEEEPLIDRTAAAAWATACDGAGLVEAVRRSMASRALYKEGLGRRHAEYKPFEGTTIATSESWTKTAPHRRAGRARTRMSFISINQRRLADWRVSDGEMIVYRTGLPATVVNALPGLPLSRLLDEPVLGRVGTAIASATSLENGALRIGFARQSMPVSEAATWIDALRSDARIAA